MAERAIYDKLQQQLLGTRLFKQEMEAVYFLVELRKFMEHNGADHRDEYAIIKFYCDWAVHTNKSRNLDDLKPIFDRVYESCKERVESANTDIRPHVHILDNFLRFADLRESLIAFFREFYFDVFMLVDEKCWQSFVKVLLMVLQDQPIKNEKERGGRLVKAIDSNIKEIRISEANERGAQMEVYFYQPIVDKEGTERHWVGLSSGHPL